jgi:hypothetical protein
VTAERLVHIFELMESHQRLNPHDVALCSVAADVTKLGGAAIMLESGGGQVTPMCASDEVAQKLMDLEITLGEGPGVSADRRGVFVQETNLLAPESARWLLYALEAVAIDVRAVFGYPIRIGAARFGSLMFYCNQPGPLDESQSSDAYLMASVIGRAVLAMQAGAPGESLEDELAGLSMLDFTVHQAAGMLAVQAALPVKDALVALRSHAFATDLSPSILANRLINRQTRFDRESGTWHDDILRKNQ